MSVNRIDRLQSISSISKDTAHVPTAQTIKDDLSKANRHHQNYLPSKPDLSKCPRVNTRLAINRFIPFVETVEKSQNGILVWRMDNIEDLQDQLKSMAEEHHQDGKRLKTAQEKSTWWTQTGAIAGVAGAATSMVVGYYLWQDPNTSKWFSGGMMAAGGASVLSTTLNASGMCPQLSAALSLAAGILGLTIGGGSNLEQILYGENTTTNIIGILSSSIQFASALGGGIRKADLVQENKNIDKNRTNFKRVKQKLELHCSNAEHLVEMANHLHQSAMEHLKDQIEQMRIAKSVASAA